MQQLQQHILLLIMMMMLLGQEETALVSSLYSTETVPHSLFLVIPVDLTRYVFYMLIYSITILFIRSLTLTVLFPPPHSLLYPLLVSSVFLISLAARPSDLFDWLNYVLWLLFFSYTQHTWAGSPNN